MIADSLQGMTALVTGASRGIGEAAARALAVYGARVALVSRNADTLQALALQIGGGSIAAPCDVTDETAVRRMVESVAISFGGVPDIVVNNAGIFRIAPLVSMPDGLFEETIRVNLLAPFFIIRACLPAMRTRGSGHIITIGSIADRAIMPENGAYSPAKYGLRAMHEVLRAETRGIGVRATLIAPAATDTQIWDSILAEDHARTFPSRDAMLSPTAVAEAVVYAASQPRSVNIDELRLSRS